MRLDRTFKITSDQFYDYLEQQVIEDVEKATSKKIRARDIKAGFKYVRKTDAGDKIIVTVKDYQRGKTYSVSAHQFSQDVTTTYTTEQTPEGLHILMDFFSSDFEKKKDTMGKVKRTYQETVYYGRMSSQLISIIDDIQRDAEGITRKQDMPGRKAAEHLSKFINKKLFGKGNNDDD